MASLSQITCICIGTNEAKRKVNCEFRPNRNYHSKRYIYFIGSSKYDINIHLHQSFFSSASSKKKTKPKITFLSGNRYWSNLIIRYFIQLKWESIQDLLKCCWCYSFERQGWAMSSEHFNTVELSPAPKKRWKRNVH